METIEDTVAYRRGGRGTGKTTRLIKALPNGGIFVTHSNQMVKILKVYLREIGRENDEITVIAIDENTTRGRMIRQPVAIDHIVEEDHRLMTALTPSLSTAPMILRTDNEGDVVVTFNEYL